VAGKKVSNHEIKREAEYTKDYVVEFAVTRKPKFAIPPRD
jgi:hypothetical protein